MVDASRDAEGTLRRYVASTPYLMFIYIFWVMVQAMRDVKEEDKCVCDEEESEQATSEAK